jgi:hypothetical protein
MVSLLSQRSLCRAMACLALLVMSGCGGKGRRDMTPDPVASQPGSRLDWLAYDPARVSARGAGAAGGQWSPELIRDDELAKIAAGFGLERPQKMDLGVYGKIGKHTVFVAPRRAIGDYDRLYWVMVRVLSEKYGCFIKSKVSTAKIVRFECRDRRTVVLERDISGSFAKFSGRQFDLMGREILIKPRPVASR